MVEIEADGNTIIAVRRTGLTNEQKQRLKYFDNRAGELAAWDAKTLLADLQSGVDLGSMFDKDELDALLAGLKEPDWNNGFSGLPTEDRQPFQQMTFTLHDTQADQVKQAIAIATKLGDFTDSPNQNSNGNALAFICETFITEHGQS